MPRVTCSHPNRSFSLPIRVGALAIVAGLLVFSGCGSDAPVPATFSLRDSAGLLIAENSGELPEGGTGWSLSSRPTLQIGRLEGDDAYTFQRIWGATRLSDGRTVVVDNRAADVRIFSPSGEHLHTFGRRGEGPGEFNSPVLMGMVAADTLVVVDRRLRRINLFHPDEGFIRSATADTELQGYLLTVGMFDSGATLIQRARFTQDMPNGLFRFPIQYRTVALDGSLGADFGEFPGDEVVYASQAVEGGSTVMSTSRPFGKSPSTAVSGHRFFYSSQDSYEIQVRDDEGTLLGLIRRDRKARAVTESDIEDLMEELSDNAQDSDQERQFRRMLRESPIPDFHPALGAIYADALGYLWVEEVQGPGEDTRQATVFDPEGRMVGSLTLPDRFQVQEIGADYVLGRWVDDFGVNYLRLYELTRPR